MIALPVGVVVAGALASADRAAPAIILEDDTGYILLEDGGRILLEQDNA